MKTTLDIPNDLYREVKATAALEQILMKDLVAEGLRLVLAARGRGIARPSPLEVLKSIRQKPLHSSEEIAHILSEQRRLRKQGWNQEDDS